ncbi:hybrid sensor histidine kinase/response regulator [Gemmata obscuriglobus]|uniref:hybrid sensor histidine kinase/response regulator n=1 Tax=Gemmata obscuriglobus TaxID=114 RepID=UPI0013A6EB63|nr:hybrid sensor histidine kinase/response regulator [Gemmata obscuriglobus]
MVVFVRRVARERDQTAALLRQATDTLESRVRIRTAGLAADADGLRHELAERTRAEDELRANEERFRALVSTSVAIVWRADPVGEFETEQPEWSAFTGQPFGEHRGHGWLRVVHPEDQEPYRGAWAAARSERREFETEHRLWHASGEYRRMVVRGVPILDADGTVREWVGTHTEVAHEGAAGADERTRLAFQLELLPLAYLLSDEANRYTYWNSAAERVFGFARAEVLGKRPFEVVVPARARGAAESTFARLATGDRDAHEVAENVTKSGREILCEWHHAPLVDAAGTFQGVLSLAQDVTAARRHEDQFRQTQKMDAICQLAGGVAHDFNNLLTIINGYTRQLIAVCPEGTPAGDALGEVRAASARATDLTRQLLAFGRLQVLRPQVLNVNGLVTEAQKVLTKLVGGDVRLVLALGTNLGLVSADPDQIEQALATLCVYAREAMPQGGRLTLTTDAVDLHDGGPAPGDLAPGRYVRLMVADTGYGMTVDVKGQIFEPFFSTQGVGKGAGLGLASVYGIVKQSGGHIVVDSTIGVGTTFTMYLPAAAKPVPVVPKAAATPRPRGGETVLLVEDERPVRVLAALTLRGAGYKVAEAGSGEEALELYKTRGPIHLLLTDVVMSGMSGRELADALREQDPGLRLLYMSGYTDDPRVRHGIESADAEFLQKPFEVDDLLTKVRQVLSANEPAALAGSRA